MNKDDSSAATPANAAASEAGRRHSHFQLRSSYLGLVLAAAAWFAWVVFLFIMMLERAGVPSA